MARTDVGLVRTRNEDGLVDRPEDGLWAVVDGMGGHAGGARASGLIRDALAQFAPLPDADACVAAVRARIEDVHAQLHAAAGRAGSTVVVLLAAGGRFACIWAGDSRLQRWRAGRLERLSTDHSLLEELVASGTVPPEQAHRHPLANRITRAVGIGQRLELDVIRGDFAPGDRYLLSSDGLHGVVKEGQIAELLATPDLNVAADRLIAAVKQAGAPDNVTIVLVGVERDAGS
ncbi:MAG TPA: PP2C family serine/threonine-protein phosphatase [Kofleriaceae bacterium]|nr:PP2C family serine/threonine-protein phosphatase [Kofleriaceae bacterium]